METTTLEAKEQKSISIHRQSIVQPSTGGKSRWEMPNETADALARMLSLSTEKQHATAPFSQQPVLIPLTRKNSRANVFEGDPWTFVHYPRDKSLETSLFHNAERALDEASPDYAPGPLQFEDAYADPYGSAAHQSPLGFWVPPGSTSTHPSLLKVARTYSPKWAQ